MNLTAFAETLSDLMKEAHYSRAKLAQAIPVSLSQVDHWKYAQRAPNPEDMIALIKIFKQFLTVTKAQTWAEQADCHLTVEELQQIYPPVNLFAAPLPSREGIFMRLPPLVGKLFGVNEAKERLIPRFKAMDDHWLLALDGMGGIGKTTLANFLVRDLLTQPHFYDMVWLTAKQVEFSADKGLHDTPRPVLTKASLVDLVLQQLDPNFSLARPPQEKLALLTHWLKQQPYLIVIDNLETVTDYEELLPLLGQLANPTKFLLTSRESLSHHHHIYSYKVLPLSREETHEMLWYAGETQNIPRLREATSAQLSPIYDTVEGNPLALRLIIGQIRHTSLTTVLAQLKAAQGRKIEDLYTHIYWDSWRALDEMGRRVLRIMGVIGSGTAEDIIDSDDQDVSLNDLELQNALEQLMRFSLVEERGTLEMPMYAIHRLTETFLLGQVFKWEALS